MPDDAQLLRRYVQERSQEAFAEIVRRHINVVYFAALRRVGGDAHLADDVAQNVFADLARKAASLHDRTVLTGWLYTSTRFAAAQAVRSERRRRNHEQEAQAMNELQLAPDPDWNRLRPIIDDVMDELDDQEREAVLLRFFEQQPFAEVGARFSLSPDAARMRVERALEKLRGLLAKRGIGSTSAALAAAFTAQAGLAAPVSLVARIVAGAFAPAGAATASTLALWKILTGAAVGLAGVGWAIHEIRHTKTATPATQDADAVAAYESIPISIEAERLAIIEATAPAPVPTPSAVRAAAPAETRSALLPFGMLSERQRGILKTLWERRKTSPATQPPGWSFKPGPTAAAGAAAEFADASAFLEAHGLVGINPGTGTVFLTTVGDAFCQLYAEEIDAFRRMPGALVPMRFAALPAVARDILKTLWEHQKISPDQPPRRWGFKVPADSRDFPAFEAAVAGLREVNGLVGVSPRTGIVFLSDRGRAFCETHAAEIDAHPLPARNFRPLTP